VVVIVVEVMSLGQGLFAAGRGIGAEDGRQHQRVIAQQRKQYEKRVEELLSRIRRELDEYPASPQHQHSSAFCLFRTQNDRTENNQLGNS
jgi:hypothetical protein